MQNKSKKFIILDIFYLALALIPLLAGIVLKILLTPASQGVTVTGALVYFTIPMPLQDFPVTEAQVNSAIVVIMIFALCLYITHGIRAGVKTKRGVIAEWMVEKVKGMVNANMGDYFKGYAPFIAAILGLSALSSLMSLFGLYSPTADINIIAGWAILVFILITYYKLKCGPLYYLKGFTEPVVVLTPINLISEVATPISMAFRHYGNALAGTVISVLLASGLSGLSASLFGSIPVVGEIPILQVGIPAVLSIYFDVFSACLQAYIFAMLTMLNVSSAFPMDEYEVRRIKKLEKKIKAQKA